jgi:hypothetical protein
MAMAMMVMMGQVTNRVVMMSRKKRKRKVAAVVK